MGLQWDALLVEVNALGVLLSVWYYFCYYRVTFFATTSGTSSSSSSSSTSTSTSSGNIVTDALVSTSLGICFISFRLLLFRLMFGSGVVKLASGDDSWLGE